MIFWEKIIRATNVDFSSSTFDQNCHGFLFKPASTFDSRNDINVMLFTYGCTILVIVIINTPWHTLYYYICFFYPCDFKNNRHSVVVLHSFLCCSGYWRILSYFRANISCQFNIYWLVLLWKSCDSMVSWLFWLDELTTTENTLTYSSALCLSPQKFCISMVFSFSRDHFNCQEKLKRLLTDFKLF